MPRKTPLTVGYITVDDPHDRRTWSGTHHFLLKALEDRFQKVVVLGPLRPRPVLFCCQVINYVSLALLKKRFNYRDSFVMAKAYRRMLRRRMGGQRFDLLIAPAGLTTTALLDVEVPIIHINDRSIAGALDYHVILKDLFAFSQREGLELERISLRNAALTIYASDWAAEAARRAEPSAAHKVKVLPFGVNLPELPPRPAARAFPSGAIKLLFIGVKWKEKGGPIAYETLLHLKRSGIAAQLVVVGCTPPPECNDADLLREGFLDKNAPGDLERLQEHLRTADFLIVPTRFEAFGIVFCEAAAYGIPALGTRTGGVPTIVQHGRTGYLFDLSEDGGAYAERIQQVMEDPQQWQQLRTQARARFEDVLNWPAFVDGLIRYSEEAGIVRSAR